MRIFAVGVGQHGYTVPAAFLFDKLRFVELYCVKRADVLRGKKTALPAPRIIHFINFLGASDCFKRLRPARIARTESGMQPDKVFNHFIISQTAIAAAAAAFSDSALPRIGMVIFLYAAAFVSSVSPLASLPIITAQPGKKLISEML